MNGLYTVVEFDENDKWFVAAEKEIDGVKYSYLMRVNNEETDFIDEYKIVSSLYYNNEEYMDTVNDQELIKKIIPILVPESNEYMNNPEKLRELLKTN